MSATFDPAKLKVAELRVELQSRGLDTKGVKAILVKRLKDALEKELSKELPDTSIADTSTEELDTSATEQEAEAKQPEKEEHVEAETVKADIPDEKKEAEPSPEPQQVETPVPPKASPKKSPIKKVVEEPKPTEEEELKSRTSPQPEAMDQTEAEPEVEEKPVDGAPEEKAENDISEAPKEETETKGEKRKHSPSPERAAKRSKSPIKEDEPVIPEEKVLLSWYDSDLHLQVDKENFLSAKPYHEGAFGYTWAGVRATHGVSFGKACFEVKLTQELAFEDLAIIQKRERNNPYQRDYRDKNKKQEKPAEKKSETDKKPEDKPTEGNEDDSETKQDEGKAANGSGQGEIQSEKSEETMDASEKQEEDKDKSAEDDAEEPKDESKKEEVNEPQISIPSHLFRVGWSLSSCSLQLGEEEFSYGYESTGRFVHNKEFQKYGLEFKVGDVVGAYVEVTNEVVNFFYTVNGEPQPQAACIPRSQFPEENFALFPHVLTRNIAFEFNFGEREEAWFNHPLALKNYQFIASVEDKVAGPSRPENRSDCEVILMFGLIGSGKTHWVQEHVKNNPGKRYNVIGNSEILERMTVDCKPIKQHFKGNWSFLMKRLQRCLAQMSDLAPLRRRNYIFDQTNVYPSSQRRKMRPFEGFKRSAVVVVVDDEEQAKRQSMQEAQDGKDVPDSAIFEIKANMTLPQKCEWIDEVIYTNLQEEEVKAKIAKYNKEGKQAGYGFNRDGRDNRNRWGPRHDQRGGNYRDYRPYNRYDNRPWQRPSGGWDRRRDTRPPPPGARDWRNRPAGGRPQDRNNSRDRPVSNYNRNPPRPGNRPGGNWQGWSGQGGWGQQAYGQNWGGQWSNAAQNQWKYGGGGGQYGGYNNYYYGQYPQNWPGQQQQGQGQAAASSANQQYYQQQQQAWAQYAQQYAQGQQNAASANAVAKK